MRSAWLAALALVVSSPGKAHEISLRRSPVVVAVEKVRPTVVSLAAAQLASPGEAGVGRPDPASDPLGHAFFEPGRGPESPLKGLGTGVIVDPSGYIVTNEHVVVRARRIQVILSDKRALEAEVIGTDPDSDLALLKVSAGAPLPAMGLTPSGEVLIGETAIAIGNPFGLSHTVTTGVVSAVARAIELGGKTYSDFIQTDASINPGNSGGPLINLDGELIGINTAIYGDGRGIGFAIPAERVRRVVSDLRLYGLTAPAWIGLEARPPPPGLGRDLGLAGAGLVVTRVYPFGPAAEASIEPGDVLTALGGEALAKPDDLDTYLSHHSAGDLVMLQVLRDGEARRVPVRSLEASSPLIGRLTEVLMGLSLSERSGGGLAISSIEPGGRAALHRLREGDVIFELNGRKLATLADWRSAFFNALGARSVLLLVGHEDEGVYLPFQMR